MSKSQNEIRKIILDDVNNIEDIYEFDHRIEDETNKSSAYDVWDRDVNNYFAITTENYVKTLPTGVYGMGFSHVRNDYYIILNKYIKEEYIELPDSASSAVIKEINTFMERKEKFREYDMTFKRGMLLYGPPGCGKSVTLKEITDLMLNKYNSIVIDLAICTSNEVSISEITNFIKTKIRSVEPDRTIVILLEDIDNYIERHHNEAELINLLDGFGTIDNVIYLATTNNPEKLHDRIINRPNRFDMRLLVDYPNENERRNFIIGKLTDEDIKKHNIDKWVADTEDFSISHLTELIKLVVVFGDEYEPSIEQVKNMNKNKPHSKDFKNKASNPSMGFGSK